MPWQRPLIALNNILLSIICSLSLGKHLGTSVGIGERLVYPRSNTIDKFLGRTDQNEFRFPYDFSSLHIIRQVKVD